MTLVISILKSSCILECKHMTLAISSTLKRSSLCILKRETIIYERIMVRCSKYHNVDIFRVEDVVTLVDEWNHIYRQLASMTL